MKRGAANQHVFLVGVKASGKTAVGRLVARRLQRRFIDLDDVIEELYADETGNRTPVREIYRIDNGASFRRLEAAACDSVARSQSPAVVASGGGVCDNEQAAGSLSGGLVVHIHVDQETLFERIMRRGVPPFLEAGSEDQAREAFAALYRRRTERYLELADVTVAVGTAPPQEVADLLVRRIEEHEDGRK